MQKRPRLESTPEAGQRVSCGKTVDVTQRATEKNERDFTYDALHYPSHRVVRTVQGFTSVKGQRRRVGWKLSLVSLKLVGFPFRGEYWDFSLVWSVQNKCVKVVSRHATVTYVTHNGHCQLVLTVTLHLIDAYLRDRLYSLPGQLRTSSNNRREEGVQNRHVLT